MLSVSLLGGASARLAMKVHTSILKHTGASFCLFEKPLVEALEVAVCRVRLLWSGQVRSVMQIVMVVWENEREAGVC